MARRRKQTNMTIPCTILEEVDKVAEECMLSRSAVVTMILCDHFKKLKEEEGEAK